MDLTKIGGDSWSLNVDKRNGSVERDKVLQSFLRESMRLKSTQEVEDMVKTKRSKACRQLLGELPKIS
jgi:hypothetical protein